ncbi:AzlC family ABC transporter permease [Agromyces archimandritae]|uniref:AzlC family ABC transporter permease n=1 Tax=Agromyces archimandritae TaxID=2781962 RepID=A0A975FNX6_9MICO|nr:AzlC family ABC transporter permease [Agromyces archimandritae]QTX05895.1 AzlC family ABC transporter permease [Agromyces archimandritae]
MSNDRSPVDAGSRRIHPRDLRDASGIGLAVALVAVSYGALAAGAGFPLWLVVIVAASVLAGASELLFVSVVAAGGAPLVAALAGILVNVRNGIYAYSAGAFLRGGPSLALAAHVVNDESVALAQHRTGVPRRRAAFWAAGLAILIVWPLGAIAGALLGAVVDPHVLGLDAALPAILVAMVLPAARDRRALAAMLAGGAIALAATPFVAPGVASVLALLGLGMPWLAALMRRRAAAARGPVNRAPGPLSIVPGVESRHDSADSREKLAGNDPRNASDRRSDGSADA